MRSAAGPTRPAAPDAEPGVPAELKVEIWSDVVCLWCYIGKRRIETALEGFEHSDQVEVQYRSFELNPDAPRTRAAAWPTGWRANTASVSNRPRP